ncbi:CLUMA_CG013895, isoform A [Clunio marinus]|uniref:CLUMA_CG013895, isoform A n=1 Tax=Clunio marinus TaxID=568069 RepID=A0A1J1IK75_9DIPT|nr:CLUMA_CG013895, isoform A [Clunio marinus]
MNCLVLCVLVGLIAMTSAQWNNQQQYPNVYPQLPNQPFPNQPNINELCRQPGANCKIDSRFAEESSVTDPRGNTFKYTRVCDDRGCYDRKVYNGSSAISASYILITFCAVIIGVKVYFH